MDRVDIQQYWFDNANFKGFPDDNAEKEFLKMYKMKSLPTTKGKYSKSVLDASRLMINAITQGTYGIILEDNTRFEFGSVYNFAMYNNRIGSKVLDLGEFKIEDYVDWTIRQFSAILNVFTFKRSNTTALRVTTLLYAARVDEDTLKSAIYDVFKQATKILFDKAGNTQEFVKILFTKSGSKVLLDIAKLGLTVTEFLDMLNIELPKISDTKKSFGNSFAILDDNTVLYFQKDAQVDLLSMQEFETALALNKILEQKGVSSDTECARADGF